MVKSASSFIFISFVTTCGIVSITSSKLLGSSEVKSVLYKLTIVSHIWYCREQHLPFASYNFVIYFPRRRWDALVCKNRVFLSPSESHNVFDRYLHIIASLSISKFTSSSKNFIRLESLVRRAACSTLCNCLHFTSSYFRTLPKHFLLHRYNS